VAELLIVRFLGRFADAFGPEQLVQRTPRMAVGDVLDQLADAYPQHAEMIGRPTTMTVLDEVVVPRDSLIGDATELAFLPVLSGG